MLLAGENYEKYYKPMTTGIGALHFRTKTSITEEVKHKLAAKFIQLSSKTKECLFGEIKKKIGTFKERIADEVITTWEDDDDLTWMLFLDGCSILQFIYSFDSQDLAEFNITNGQAALIQQDLLLLENQIPFGVLQLLIELSSKKTELIGRINNFIVMNIKTTFHQLYSWRLRARLIRRTTKKKTDLLVKNDSIHLLDFMRSVLLLGSDDGDDESSENKEHIGRSFRNVQDLKTAGIKLKPSDEFSLRAISFRTRWVFRGELKLPSLTVDDSTARKLWNLAAYEMCPDYHGNFGVISYISFLDSLIDNEEDVKYLRSAHILRNNLSSDAEVARLFNTIGSYLVTGGDNTYSNVKRKIQKHYERRFPTWMAQVYYTHFRTPWTILALLVAATVLLLTTIQTWYTVHPNQ